MTSTLAGLFAIGLELENVANVVAASLFQDLGLAHSDLPHGQATLHPQASVEILRQRWESAPQSVCRAILEHHEHWDGSGFPHRLAADQISLEAQILSLANHFTAALTDKHANSTVNSILASIQKQNWVSPTLINTIATIILEPGAEE